MSDNQTYFVAALSDLLFSRQSYRSTKVKAANVVAANKDSATGVENKTLIGDTANNKDDL